MTSAWLGELVRLRAIEPEDWRAFMEFDEFSDDARNAWMLPTPRSAEGYRRWATELATKDPDFDEFRLVVEGRDQIMPAGMILTHHVDRLNGTFEYGVAIGSPYQRRGYAAEAIALVLRYMFQERRFHKCDIQVFASNAASVALHRRLGFVEEGRRRESRYAGGAYDDIVLFGMTRAEFDVRTC
jgi:RimJ/RimL family protein N-acetyltransferase